MHAAVAFARPFRMPDFFLISGLFLAPRHRPRLARLSRQEGRPLRLFLCAVGDDPVRLQGADVHRRNGRARRRPRLSRSLHRAVRHAVVHLPAADLLRRREAHPRAAVAGDLARRRRARDCPHRYRLDRDRRVRASLRLFLQRLCLCAARLRAGGPRAAQADACAGRSRGMGRHQRRAGAGRLRRPAVRLAGAGLRRRRRGGRGRGADGAERHVPAAALLRPELDRHLSRLLPADGGDPHRAAQDRRYHRSRHDRASGDGGRRRRRAGLVLGGPRHALPLPVRAARLGAAPAGADRRSCSRRNSHELLPRQGRDARGTFSVPSETSSRCGHARCQIQCPSPHSDHASQTQIACRQARGRKARGRQIRRQDLPGRRFPQKGRPRLPGRRLGLHFPRLPRAAAAHPQVGRPADQRRARLLQHAVEAAQRA